MYHKSFSQHQLTQHQLSHGKCWNQTFYFSVPTSFLCNKSAASLDFFKKQSASDLQCCAWPFCPHSELLQLFETKYMSRNIILVARLLILMTSSCFIVFFLNLALSTCADIHATADVYLNLTFTFGSSFVTDFQFLPECQQTPSLPRRHSTIPALMSPQHRCIPTKKSSLQPTLKPHQCTNHLKSLVMSLSMT